MELVVSGGWCVFLLLLVVVAGGGGGDDDGGVHNSIRLFPDKLSLASIYPFFAPRLKISPSCIAMTTLFSRREYTNPVQCSPSLRGILRLAPVMVKNAQC